MFLLVGITLSGAALGYWAVQKFVLSSDGTVDAGIALFVKWAMRIFALVFTLQVTILTFYYWELIILLLAVKMTLSFHTEFCRYSPSYGYAG